ncbi:hypothetical protein QJ857_gp0095 [Tupanvirus soda lake]|uniref:DUF4326 domain-containing protein n=2 Tax=Tupanvirus TaxID=2094720 RepID=A0A6N1NXJ6_9VIRU|nr:hypothetical protein QJ857_gp0095 [Tupanvirus soda lake]QKU35928.1 hypothetical protein [Tupanvirus soda lake]
MVVPKLVRIRRKNGVIVQNCDIYIGRANNQGGWNLSNSKWHNPYTIKQYGSSQIVCQLYFKYIVNSDLFHDLPELESKTLGCWCDAPKKFENLDGFYCHGCVLIELFKIVKYHNFDTKTVQETLKNLFN